MVFGKKKQEEETKPVDESTTEDEKTETIDAITETPEVLKVKTEHEKKLQKMMGSFYEEYMGFYDATGIMQTPTAVSLAEEMTILMATFQEIKKTNILLEKILKME